MNSAKFQSFLILGNPTNTQSEVEKLSKIIKVDLLKTSPDVFIIEPQKLSISIEQIRELKGNIYQKPFGGKFKLILIKNADKMTLAAQNALLKIFEEPPVHAIIVLISKNKESILETLRSRAVTIVSKKEKQMNKTEIVNGDLETLLSRVSEIENPGKWLDAEIENIHNALIARIIAKQSCRSEQTALVKCIEAKKMITANVNPKYVLFNLIFSLKI